MEKHFSLSKQDKWYIILKVPQYLYLLWLSEFNRRPDTSFMSDFEDRINYKDGINNIVEAILDCCKQEGY